MLGGLESAVARVLEESLCNEEHSLISSPVSILAPDPISWLPRLLLKTLFFEPDDLLEKLVEVCFITLRIISSSFSLPNFQKDKLG
jgi:hypothetical protein